MKGCRARRLGGTLLLSITNPSPACYIRPDKRGEYVVGGDDTRSYLTLEYIIALTGTFPTHGDG